MSNTDKTNYSNSDSPLKSEQPKASGNNKIFWFIGGGCLLLLCVVLLIGGAGGGIYYYKYVASTSVAFTATTEVTITPIETAETSTLTPSDPSETPPVITATPTEEIKKNLPDLGRIYFSSQVTSGNEPAGDTDDPFEEGIKQIWATFTCRNMTETGDWEQVWLRDDEEEETSQESPVEKDGQCAVSLGKDDADPLPSGEWTLQIKMSEELLKHGEFTIESNATPTPTITPTVTVDAKALTPAPDGGLTWFELFTSSPQGAVGAGQDKWLTFTSKDWEKEATLIAFVTNAEKVEFFVYHSKDIPNWPPSPPLPNPMGVGSEMGNRDGNDKTKEYIWTGPIENNAKYYIRLVNNGGRTINYCLATDPNKYSCP